MLRRAASLRKCARWASPLAPLALTDVVEATLRHLLQAGNVLVTSGMWPETDLGCAARRPPNGPAVLLPPLGCFPCGRATVSNGIPAECITRIRS